MDVPISARMVVLSADELVVGKLDALGRELGLRLQSPRDEDEVSEVALVVLDLDAPDALGQLKHWRERCPEAFIAGHLGRPDPDRWVGAERAGCDLVVNRGAFVTALRRRLAASAGPRRRRIPLFDAAEVAGRLGLVHRDPASPVGPLAVYRVGNRLYAVEDTCPHAGAVLSEGELVGPVVTCPRHGSQFDVRDGERRRGPADVGIRTFPLLEEGGRIYLLLGPGLS